MKTAVLFVVGIFAAVLVMAVPAEAQYGSYGNRSGYRRPLPGGWGGGGYGYGYYDPSYLQQMMNLPDGLAACTVDLSTAKVTSCHPVVKDVMVIQAHARDHADRGEMLGTVHIEKGRFHFRPFDDTNGRLGTMSAGALGAGAGAMVGYGSTQNMRNRGKANAIGASATIGGGLLAGWMASRHTHNNCLKIEPTVAQSISEVIESQAPSQEQGTGQPVAGPVVSHDENRGPAYRSGNRPVVNSTAVYVELYDGDRKDENFVGEMSPGDSWDLGKPQKRYRAFAQVPNRRGSDTISEIDPEPTDTGWIFIEPKVAQGR